MKKSGHGKSNPHSDLNVTPMVDMLMMLVVFLLMTFSASGEILFISKDIMLPKAYNASELERAPVISVSNASIGLEGKFVMNTEDVNENLYADWKLPALYELLEQVRENQASSNPGKKFEGQVIIQSDNGVPFSVLKMVMSTCAQSKYTNFNFAIQRADRSEISLGN